MKFSIIMPTCRPHKMKIEEAVKSVRAQSEDYELIIIENGSSDTLIESIAEWNDPHIRYFCLDEANVSRARNYGMQQCTGDVICFLDCDDVLDKRALSLYRRALEETNADVLFCEMGNFYKKEEKSFVCHKINEQERNAVVRGIFNQKESTFGLYGATGEIVIRRKFLKERPIVFREDEAFEEDQTFAVALLTKAQSIAVFETPVYLYRQEKKEKKKDIGNAIFERYYHHCQIALAENRLVSKQEMNAYIIKTYMKYKSWTCTKDDELDARRIEKFKALLKEPDYKEQFRLRKLYTILWLMDIYVGCFRLTRWILEKKGR